jgi:hypothetical protein
MVSVAHEECRTTARDGAGCCTGLIWHVLRSLCSLISADGCRALRCEALSVSVLSLDALVAELLVQLVSVSSNDVGAQWDPLQAACSGPCFCLTHRCAAHSVTPRLLVDYQAGDVDTRLAYQRLTEAGVQPPDDLPVLAFGNDDEMIFISQSGLQTGASVGGRCRIAELTGQAGNPRRVDRLRGSHKYVHALSRLSAQGSPRSRLSPTIATTAPAGSRAVSVRTAVRRRLPACCDAEIDTSYSYLSASMGFIFVARRPGR